MLPSKFKIVIALWILTLTASIQSVSAINCWSCVDDCEDLEIKDCGTSGNARDNQCFYRVNTFNNDVVDAGCANVFTNDAEVVTLIKNQEVYLCTGNNCNSYENLPKSNDCVQCDSPTDERCATNPSTQTNSVSRCQKLPYTECYERVSSTSKGITKRGCLNDLTDNEFYNCLTGADALCTICKGTSCNKNVIPADRLQCHICDSLKQESCATTTPNALSICPLYDADDVCVSRANRDGSIVRGCRSELSCDGFSDADCKTCVGTGCNTVEMEPSEPVDPIEPEDPIGDPGQFTGLPLNCFHCNTTADCGGTSAGRLNMCYDNPLQVCTTAFDVRTGSVAARGCSDELASMCAVDLYSCNQCKSNGCNTVKSEADLIDCLFCDGPTNNGCALSPAGIERTRKCQKSCLTIAYVRNNTDVVPNYETLRSCLDDLDIDDQERCTAGTYPNCKPCSGAKCNTDVLLPERKSCYHCDLSTGCSKPEARKCSAWTDDDQCFVEYDETGEVAEMGCRSKYDADELKLRITQQRLWLCNADNCNSISNVPAAHNCLLCSSRTDKSCAIAPSAQTTTSDMCSKQPYTECYTRILSDGHTERGCLSSLQSDEFYNCLYGLNGTQCAICNSDNCNQNVYPTTRRSCHVCSSQDSASCASTQPAATQLCLLYNENDSCVTYLGNDGYTQRNCWSSLKCDTNDTSRCVACTTDNCNTVNLQRSGDANPGMWQSLPLTCHTCTSESACRTSSTTSTCSRTDHCVTVFSSNGNVVQRGCSSVVETAQGTYCDANPDACFNCNSNRCNNATSRYDYVPCLYCDSRRNVNCAINPSAILARRQCNGRCMTATFLREGTTNVYEVTRTCLDDKDEADRLACVNSNGERCNACNGDSCNTALIPPKRLSCYHCDDNDDCEEPRIQSCAGWRENDKCFILFYNPNDVGRMGCLSDLTDFEYEVNLRQLFTCDTDNCNSFSAIPTPKTCVACTSSTDERCATHPNSIPTVAECTTVPNVECYTSINRDGSTARGCVGNLLTLTMLDCKSGNATDCTTCLGDRCNTDIFPADRLSCHRCNSADDPTCGSAPDAAEVCPMYRADERCSAKIVEGVTYRGCSFDFTCNDANKQYCRMCDGNNCNVVDLASQQIGYPGKWQEPPINCYTCLGAECANNALGVVRKCEDNLQQNCATVFATNGSVVQRGCTDIIYNGTYGQHCDANTNLCKFCKSSGCNDATSLSNYIDCIYCDALDNRDCVFNPTSTTARRSCHKKCVTAHYKWPKSNGTYIMDRSCLDDMDFDDREACDAGQTANCQTCGSSGCNTVKIPSTRLTCYHCSGSDCASPLSQECSNYREDDQCFSLFVEGDKVERLGCRSDLEDSLVEERKRRLLLCNGNNCNTAANYPTPNGCIYCDTRFVDNCGAKPQDTTVRVACDDLPYTQCYTQLDNYGHTKRGCVVDVADPNFDVCLSGSNTNCTVCTGNNCNNVVIPAVRHSCNRCNSDDHPDCATNGAKYAESCPIYKANDQCVTMLSGEKTYRGCASDFSCNPNNLDTCRICADSNNCNTIDLLTPSVGAPGLWQDLPLNCYHCDDLSECGSSQGVARMCESNTAQTCMTVFNSAGNVEKRGCSDLVLATHRDYCDLNTDSCYKCKSNGCNTATSRNDYIDCYFCNSVSNGASCSVAFTPNTNSRTRKCQGNCMTALYPRSSSNPNTYELTRTCADDMDREEAELCAQGLSPDCVSCSSGRCNTAVLPNDGRQRLSCYKCIGEDCESPVAQQCSAYRADDQCYIIFDHESSISSMGCRSEYEENVVQSLIRQKQMLLCNGNNCNTYGSVPTPKSCSVCDSADDSRCATNPNLVGYSERCAKVPYTECFTRITASGHTQRGCLASLPADNFQGCLNGTDTLCETCLGDNCNEIDVYPSSRLRCHQCHSAIDPLCTTAPDSSKVCPIYARNDKCVTNLRNGETSRGCMSDMGCDDPNDRYTCRTCSGSSCNTANLELATETNQPGLWQDVPITCYTCSSANCASGLGVLRECEGDPYQQCVTIFDESNAVTFRGCNKTLTSASNTYCNANANKCPACNSPGCNSVTSLSDYIECWECDTHTDPSCATSTTASTLSKTRLCNKQCMTALYSRFDDEQPSYGLVRSCLDDMDLDDREDCVAGKNANCVACTGARCNTALLPATRRSCYICEGDACQDPQPQACPYYREDDQCYVRYDEQRSIVAMGCGSEFSTADAYYLLSQKRLYYCDGDNCNHFDKLPSSQACAICNSRTDVSCAIKPSIVISSTTCGVMPYTQCYTRVLGDGATERGCLSSLYDDEFVGCLNGTAPHCVSCTGSLCNKDIYPTGRRSCHICNSATDSNCDSDPDSLSVCPWYAEDDGCVTAYISGETRRGCTSEIYCDATNGNTCVKCNGDGCNTVNLAKKQDDNVGKWQDLPLTCLTCDTDQCGSTTNSERCENNNAQDCMVVFDAAGTQVRRRGCSDAVENEFDEYCDQNPNSCYKCKSNNCNTATSASQYTECVYCDTAKDQNCVWDPLSLSRRKCHGSCMTALYPAYIVAENELATYETIRTCANDKEVADQQICASGNDTLCAACTGSNCNTVNLPTDRHSCYICQGDSCEDPLIRPCPLYRQQDQCFIWIDGSNSIAQMGCLSSFRNQDLEAVLKTKRVTVCEGKNCNTPQSVSPAQKCVVCDSSSNKLCATNAEEVGTINTCGQLPYTECYSKLNNDGTTHRGCLSDLSDDTFLNCLLGKDANCETCKGSACNREVYPADRLQCYTCTSNDDANCESNPTRKLPCPVVKTSEGCVTALSGNTTIRGCISELYCDTTDGSTCRQCYGSECNAIDLKNRKDDGMHGLFQDLPLRCHTCNGTQCLNSLGESIVCKGDIHQDCMTVFDVTTGNVQRRGCAYDVEDYEDRYCRQNPNACYTCKSNECNVAWHMSEYVTCILCDSAKDSACVIDPSSTNLATRSCYERCMSTLLDGRTLRTCLDDKELYDRPDCLDANGEECRSCTSDRCNNNPIPSDRLMCYTCDSTSSCTQAQAKAQYCVTYEKNDFCFARYDNGRVAQMGCGTAVNESDLQKWDDENRLYRCDGSQCNDLSRLPAEGTCVNCDSSKSVQCAQNPSEVNVFVTCSAPYGTCITRIDSVGSTLRGCANQVVQSEQEACVRNGTCVTCDTANCNNELFPANRRRCHICNSVADDNCKDEPHYEQVCPIYAVNDRCVSRNTDDYIERGCASSFTCDTTNEDYCQICDTDNCNTHDVSGSVVIIASGLLLTITLAIATINLF